MKTLVAFFAVLFFLLPVQGQDTNVLDNDGVVALVKAGMSPNIVVKAVETQPTNFNLDPMVVLGVYRQGVPQDVIKAMMTRGGGNQPAPTRGAAPPAATTASVPQTTTKESAIPTEDGIFILRDGELQELPIEKIETGGLGGLGTIAAFSTGGLVGENAKGKIKGKASRVKLSTSTTLIARGSQEYDIIALEVGKNRDFKGNKLFSLIGGSMTPSNGGTPLNLKRTGANTYEVSLSDLPVGEYALVPSGMGMALSHAYTFGISGSSPLASN